MHAALKVEFLDFCDDLAEVVASGRFDAMQSDALNCGMIVGLWVNYLSRLIDVRVNFLFP